MHKKLLCHVTGGLQYTVFFRKIKMPSYESKGTEAWLIKRHGQLRGMVNWEEWFIMVLSKLIKFECITGPCF